MTSYTGTITEGSATITVNTNGMNEGSYNVATSYAQNNKYTSTTKQSLLTLSSQSMTRIGVGTGTDWTSNMWNSIEINSAQQAHTNYAHGNSILQKLELTGDFTLILHIGCALDNSWGFGLTKSSTDINNKVMYVQSGNKLNTTTDIAVIFGNTSQGDWDSLYYVTIERQGTTYTLSYKGNTYTFTDSYTGTVYYFMWKTGAGNIFLNDIETTASLSGG